MALTINGTDGIETNTDTGKIKVGIDDDLQIYHDGTNNYIKGATASQHVIIEANTSEIQLRPVSGEYALKAVANGATELYYDNAKKAETVTGGFTVTGVCTATSFAGSGANLTNLPASGAALTGSTDNTLVTVTGANAIAGEANLTFDGSSTFTQTATNDLHMKLISGTSGYSRICFGDSGDDDIGEILYNNANNQFGFKTNATERLIIQEDGDIFIGTSDSTGGHLTVQGKDGNSEPATIVLKGKNSSGGNNPKATIQGANNTYAWASDLRFFTQDHNINHTEHFRIDFQGNLTATDTTIGSISDSRLKTNTANYTYDLAKFKQFQPKTFDWKNPEQHGGKSGVRGFLAQDLEAVDSAYVSDYLVGATITKGKEDGTSTTSVHPDLQYLDSDGIAKSSKFGPKDAMYVSVINQLIAKIETLETKVAALEAA